MAPALAPSSFFLGRAPYEKSVGAPLAAAIHEILFQAFLELSGGPRLSEPLKNAMSHTLRKGDHHVTETGVVFDK